MTQSLARIEKLTRALIVAVTTLGLMGIGHISIGTAQAADAEPWRSDQGMAMKWARDGKYDDALPVLERLHKQYPADLDVTRDYLTVLDWSGHDDQIIALYKTLPDSHEPDYVLLAAGHAYRLLGQSDQALDIYRKGAAAYPENGSFAAGEIRILLDNGKWVDAAKVSDEAVTKVGKSQELNTVVEEARHVYAVSEAREGRYTESLQILAQLHENYPNDARVTRDFLAVDAWSGDDAGAVALYQTLPQGSEQPDYVYAAVGKAYRNLKQPSDAVALYHEALQYYPDNKDFKTAQINSLIEAGRTDEAATLAVGTDMEKQTTVHAPEPVQQTQEQTRRNLVIAKQDEAAALARSGKYDKALGILRPLIKEDPKNLSLQADYIAVLAWSGHAAEAVRAYEAHGTKPLPDFTLAAIGHSYREQKQFSKALAVYKRGHAQSPSDEVFTVGIIGSLLDVKRDAEAQKVAEDDLQANGNRVGVLVLASAAAEGNNQPIEALVYAQRAVALEPKNPDALHAQLRAEQRVGASNAIDENAQQTAVLSPREKGEMEGDRTAALVRWATLEPATEGERYKNSDQALQTLDSKIATWSKQGDAKSPELMRARFDRIVALRGRFRMQEVIDDYTVLRNQGVKIPAYVLGSVGDAYLYLRQPEAARDVYLEALQAEPNDFEIRRQLFFAYVEADDFPNAYVIIDKLRDDQPVWYYLNGEPERQPNPNRAVAEIDSANARMYAGDLATANDQLQPLVDAAPYDARNKEALGTIDLTRGWPRQALQEFRLGTRTQNGNDVANETGAALAALDMRDYRHATEQIQSLAAQYPENLDVQRAERQLAVHNMAELDADSFYNLRNSSNAGGGDGYGVGAQLYSAPIQYNWRLFAGTSYAHEDEPNGEGAVGYEQSRAGIEYRDVNLVATAAPTYNVYHQSERAGFDANADWTFNDFWTAGGGYQSFSNDTPLRALNAGVTASRYNGDVEWRQSESQEVHFDGDIMPFSDGNTRLDAGATYADRLYTTPYWYVDAIIDGNMSHNTGDENRNYYNPKLDFMGLAGPRATEILYRRYETLYGHSLQIQPGAYWQAGDGTRPAWTAIYKQTLNLNDTFEAGASVNYTHQAYDGVQEDNVSFLANIVKRF